MPTQFLEFPVLYMSDCDECLQVKSTHIAAFGRVGE